MKLPNDKLFAYKTYTPASKGSRKVANLTERKNSHNPVYGVKNYKPILKLNPEALCYFSKLL